MVNLVRRKIVRGQTYLGFRKQAGILMGYEVPARYLGLSFFPPGKERQLELYRDGESRAEGCVYLFSGCWPCR